MKAAAVARRMMMSTGASAAASSSSSSSGEAVAAAADSIIKLLGPSTTRAFRCLWMLEELQVPYDLDEAVRPQSRAARSYHPTGKVPVLLHYQDRDHDVSARHGGEATAPLLLTESFAINTYLGDTFAPPLDTSSSRASDDAIYMPAPGTLQRIKYDQFICQILSELDASSLWIHHKHNSPDLSKVFGSVPEITPECRRNFARTNAALASQCQPYLLGTHFTPADIAYVHCLEWAMRCQWNDNNTRSEKEVEWPTDLLQPYLERCRSRPAYKRANNIRKKSMVEQQRRAQQQQQQQQAKQEPEPSTSSAPSKL